MRLVCLLAMLLPGLAQAGFISFESSQSFASTSVSGCHVVRWDADGGAVSEYECGASSDAGVTSASTSGPGNSFNLSTGLQYAVLNDDEYALNASSYFSGNWFEGNFQGTFGWTGVFTLTDDAILSTEGFGDRSISKGSNSLLVRSIPSGELLYGGIDPITELNLLAGTKYAVTWLTSQSGYGVVTGGSVNAGALPRASLNITRVPEPGTLALFGAAMLGLFVVRRREQNKFRPA